MNMMVNASELVGSEAEKNKISEIALKKAVSKLVASWEKKQAARAKKIGGLGFLAVSLAACNSSSDDTATPATPATPTTPATPAAPTVNNITVAAATTSVFGTADNDVIGSTSTTLTNAHIIADSSTADADILNIVTTGDYGGAAGTAVAPTVVGIETVNFILESVTALGTTTDAIFQAGASNMAAGTFTMDVNKVASPIASGTLTGLATGSIVTFSDDFSTAATVTGDDNAALTVTASADTITANTGAGAATATTMTGTDSAAGADTTMVSNSDATATFTTTGGDMTINATAATTVVATSAGDIDADTNNLTAATSVTLTSAHEMAVEMAAAATATLSAGGTTASTVKDGGGTGTTLTSITLSGNGSAHSFNLTDASSISAITLTGSQNVTAIVDAADLDGLTSNKITVTDNTADAASANITTTLQIQGTAGDVDATAAAVDAITLAVSNAAKTLTVASGATVVIATDQAGTTTIDGPDAGADSNSVTIAMNDGATATNDTPDITGGLTITDFKTATIDASVESTTVAGATLNDTTFAAIDGSSDNTNLTIKGGSNTMTLSGTHTVGTGAFTIESNAAVALGASDITANVFTHTGSGAVTWTDANSSEVKTISTGSGNDAITLAVLTENMTLNSGGGDDTITIGTNTAASKTYSITGGDGADILSLSADNADLNNGTAFTMSGVETISMTAAVDTGITVGNALLHNQGIIIDHASETDTFDINVEMGTAVATDLSSLTINTTRITTADEIVISNSTATAALTLTGANGIQNDFDTGSGADVLTGGTVNDDLDGAAGNDIISGGDGDDTLTGGAGTDTITGGKGADIISGDAGADTLVGGAGGDTYVYDTGDVASGETITETSSDTGTDIVSVNTTTDFTALTAASLDNVEQVLLASGVTATFTGAQVTAENFEVKAAGGTENVVVNMAFGGTLALNSLTFNTWTSGTDVLTVNGTGGNETITGTANVDTIVTGAGTDTINASAGADVITVTGSTATLTIVDHAQVVITGFTAGNGTGADLIKIDMSEIETDAGGNADVDLVTAKSAGTSIAAGDTVVLGAVTGDFDMNAVTANANILVLNTTTTAGAVDTALETGGSSDLTADGAIAAKDVMLVLSDDGADSYLTHVEFGAVANDAKPGSGTLAATTLVKFSGVTDCNTFHADNFSFIA